MLSRLWKLDRLTNFMMRFGAWYADNRPHYLLILRSALFFACLSTVLHGIGRLESLDDFAIKFISESQLDFNANSDKTSYTSAVLTLTDAYFMTGFGGHTPINREHMIDLIEKVIKTFTHIDVLAIDYDLSPAVNDCSDHPPSDCSTDTTGAPQCGPVCAMSRLQAEQQQKLDQYLKLEGNTAANSALAQWLKAEPGRKRKLILIRPLTDEQGTPEGKKQWQKNLQDNYSHIRFADHYLLFHPWFSTVIKYRISHSTEHPCNPDTPLRPLADEVQAGLDCADPDHAPKEKEHTHGDTQIINFGDAAGGIFVCDIWTDDYIDTVCPAKLKKLTKKSTVNEIKSVFIGAAYGKDDLYRTPIGDVYGVQIHAASFYSILHPINKVLGSYTLVLALLIDWLFGFLAGIVFYVLWTRAKQSNGQPLCRFLLITAVFGFLLSFFYFSLWLMPWMLRNGIWLNPIPVLIGVLIDSYASAIEQLGEKGPIDDRPHGGGWWVYEFTGMTRHNQSLLANVPTTIDRRLDFVFLFLKRILMYWAVVLFAFGHLISVITP